MQIQKIPPKIYQYCRDPKMQVNPFNPNQQFPPKVTHPLQKYYTETQQRLNCDCEYGGGWRNVLLRDWTVIRILILRQCNIHNSDAKMIGDMDWPNLQQFCLDNNSMTGTGISWLLAKQFPKLQQLYLIRNRIGDEGMQALASAHQLPQLSVLDLTWNHITANGFTSMPHTKITKLKCLILNQNNQIGRQGIQLLIKAQLPLLEQLALDWCDIGNTGIKYLAKSYWSNLARVQLLGNKLKYDGCSALTLADWSKVSRTTVCSFQQQSGPISVMNLVAINWPLQRNIMGYDLRYSNMKQPVDAVINHRFTNV